MKLAILALLALVATTSARRPVQLVQPTGIELEPAGSLLVVENNPGRILRFDPKSGRVTVLARGLTQPYAIVRARSGAVFFSTYTNTGGTIQRLGRGVIARNATGYGPLAIAPDGALYYANAVGVFRVGGGRIAPQVHVSIPHGIAVARDGSLLVSDTGDDRVLRIDARGLASTFASVPMPRGIDVAADGTVYVVDPVDGRVVHLAATGRRLGWVGPRLPGDPYDLQAGPNGSVYVLEAGPVGDIVRVARNGSMRLL